jgi:DNA-binding NtrC family response regulator
VIPVALPPLRDRREDIPDLLEHFLNLNSNVRTKLKFAPDTIELLQSYSWPDNIRELGNLVAYLTAMVETETVEVADLPPKLRDKAMHQARTEKAASAPGGSSRNFYEQVEMFEKDILDREFKENSGNISRLALNLGMDRSHLYSKLKQYKIHPKS